MSVIPNLEAMLNEGQDNSLLRFGLGNAYLLEKHPEKAIEHYQRALIQDERYTAAWKMYAKALIMIDKLEQAKTAYQKGIEVAEEKGDYQAVKEMKVFLKQLNLEIA